MKKRLLLFVLKRIDWRDVGLWAINYLLDRLKKAKTDNERNRLIDQFYGIHAVFDELAKSLKDLKVERVEYDAIEASLETVITTFSKK